MSEFNEREAHAKLVTALCAARLDMPSPKKDGKNSYFDPKDPHRYATLDNLYECVSRPLAQHGLSLSHEVDDDGKVLITRLMHVEGAILTSRMPIYVPVDKNGRISPQTFGSALTYTRRYAIISLLGLPGEDDDDGHIATQFANAPAPANNQANNQPHAVNTHTTYQKRPTDEMPSPTDMKELRDFCEERGLVMQQTLSDLGYDLNKLKKSDLRPVCILIAEKYPRKGEA